MDTVISFCKENYQLIVLFVSLLGVTVGCLSLAHELKRRNRNGADDNQNPDQK